MVDNPIKPTNTTTTPTPNQATDGKKAEDKQQSSGLNVVQQVAEVFPEFKDNIVKYFPLLAREAAQNQMTSVNHLIAMCATLFAECGFEPKKEGGVVDYVTYGPDEPVGRGFIQLTLLANYKAAKDQFKVDCVANPDLLLEPELAAKIFCWYWCASPQPSAGYYDIRPYAEKGDWDNVRSIVNKGGPGLIHKCTFPSHFEEGIERGKAGFKFGIDPNAIPLPGTYGASDFDTGGAAHKTMIQQNPTSQLSALEYALGLYAAEAHKSIRADLVLDLAGQPDILNLDAQTTFKMKGLGQDLDDTYTVESVLFIFGYTAEAHVKAYKPDPKMGTPQILKGDANKPDVSQGTNQRPDLTGLNQKIYAAAVAAKGRSSAEGPGGGNVACAWAVNLFVIQVIGLPMLGGEAGMASVVSCVQDMEGGRAQKVSRDQAIAGDIWIAFDMAHIGIMMDKTTVLSNSSSKASFSWEDNIDSVNGFYGGSEHGIYRLNK